MNINRDYSCLPIREDWERRLRRLLFLNHSSCDGRSIYGDDGEMHCHACDIDFVRDSAKDIERVISEINLARVVDSTRGEG